MTILSAPAAYSSVHDDLIYTVHDNHVADSVTYSDYKYIADVYIDATLVQRIKKVPDPETGIGIFNISQIVRSYLETALNPTANSLVAQRLGSAEFSISVTVKFGEQYGGTAYPDTATDSARTFFNYYTPRGAASLSAKADDLASASPLTGQVLQDSAFYFVPYFPLTTGTVAVTVTTGGGLSFPTSFTPNAALELQVLNLAPAVINTLYPGAVTGATEWYTVQIGEETYTLNIVCEAQYTPYTLHFLNRYGGFESKIFQKVSRKTLDIQKKDFGKLAYTVDSSGVVSYKNAGGVYNETTSVYASQYREKLTLNSDLLTDAEYLWLCDLVVSPMVFIEEGAYFYPCQIKETNYEPKKAVNDDLTNLTLNIEYGITHSAQFR